MLRHSRTPRSNWRSIVEEQGLAYAVDRSEEGTDTIYWDESAEYELSLEEVEHLETVTDELHDMSIEASKHMLSDRRFIDRLGMPLSATALLQESIATELDTCLYGRFDLAYNGVGDVKLLEYNADTPAALFEAAVTQWHWLEDTHGDHDQWNLIHERLVVTWRRWMRERSFSSVHFAVGQNEPSEDWVTVAYLRDTAVEAGVDQVGIVMEEIGWDHDQRRFVDIEGRPITACFKMYPWDWMLREDFAAQIMAGESDTKWIEPAWKLLAGSKLLLVALWEIFPRHELLLPASMDAPAVGPFVSKPLYGWEGAGITIDTGIETVAADAKHTSGQPVIYQQYTPLPVFDGNRAVLGTWVVGGEASGLGIRESTSLITDTHARFVPHFINAPRSTPDQIEQWLADDQTKG